MAMIQTIARRAAAALVALSLASPLLAEGAPGALPGAPDGTQERDLRNLVLGLAALAAVGLVLHEISEDGEEDERRLPTACLASWPTPRGEVVLYDPDCLDERLDAADRLPLSCAVTLRSRGRFVSGFDSACLREEGWRRQD